MGREGASALRERDSVRLLGRPRGARGKWDFVGFGLIWALFVFSESVYVFSVQTGMLLPGFSPQECCTAREQEETLKASPCGAAPESMGWTHTDLETLGGNTSDPSRYLTNVS